MNIRTGEMGRSTELSVLKETGEITLVFSCLYVSMSTFD